MLYCAKQKFLRLKYDVDANRLLALCSECDVAAIQDHLHAFEKVALAKENSGPIGKLPIAERFRWLTATRSTIVQTSKVHPGFCDDANETLEKLYKQLVG